MNYPLLLTVGSLVAGMFGMERWCSWRLNVSQRRRITSQVPLPPLTAETSMSEDAQGPAESGLPAQA